MARVHAVTISLSDDERAELEALSRRRKTSQGLARLGSDRLGGGAISRVGERGDRRSSRGDASEQPWARRRRPLCAGGRWTVCTTNARLPARRVKSAMTGPSRKRSGHDVWKRRRRTRPIGARSLDGRGRAATRPRPVDRICGPSQSACSRIARRPSSCRAIRFFVEKVRERS